MVVVPLLLWLWFVPGLIHAAALSPPDQFNETGVTPDTKLILGMAWIQEFLAIEGPAITAQTTKANQEMKSAIKHYELNDLKQWTQKINSDNNHLHKDITYKKYSTPTDESDSESESGVQPPQKLRDLGFKVDKLIQFLIEKGGFTMTDLQFLKQETTLDYGLKEIEQELNKLRNRQNERPINIKIGGEEEDIHQSVASCLSLSKVAASILLMIMMLLIF